MMGGEALETMTSKYNFDETVGALKDAIQTAGFLLIHEINTQQILGRHGILINGFKQLLYFNPVYMKQLLDLHPEAAIQAPLKFLVREEQNGVVKVSCFKPSTLFSSSINLDEFSSKLDEISDRISASIIS